MCGVLLLLLLLLLCLLLAVLGERGIPTVMGGFLNVTAVGAAEALVFVVVASVRASELPRFFFLIVLYYATSAGGGDARNI